jgi:hypothetical protein
MVIQPENCTVCGHSKMKKIGDIKNTRLFICPECFAEQSQFIGKVVCEHEYDDRNSNKCIHCGEPSINYK